MRIIEKIGALFLVIIFLTFMINHGEIDFSGVDFVVTKTKDAVNSEEGKEITGELKDITVDIAGQITDEVKNLIANKKDSGEKQKVDLVSVVDGDTLIVNLDGSDVKVRLIGIDTPESVNPDDTKNNEYGVMASDHTKELLKNYSSLYLEFDEEIEDQYGRVLAYVWLTDNKEKVTTDIIKTSMLNGIILRDGYAMNKVYEPNDKYASSFDMIRSSAEETKTGLWQYDDFTTLWDAT